MLLETRNERAGDARAFGFFAPVFRALRANMTYSIAAVLFLAGWLAVLSLLPEEISWANTGPLFVFSLVCLGVALTALRAARKKIDSLSIADPLTGLYTERYFFRALNLEFNRSNRHDLPLSLVLFSIDELQETAGLSGQKPGEIHKKILKSISSTIRESDIFSALENGRYTLLLPNTNVDGAQTAANRVMGNIRTELKKSKIGRHVDMPFGICGIGKEEVDSSEELFAGSVQAYSAARQSPRNKVVICGTESG